MRKRRFRDERLYDRGGRFIWARVRDEHGRTRRVSTGRTSEEAAVAWADEYERKAADPSYARAAEWTLADAIADWLDERRRQKTSRATFEIASLKLGHFVRMWGASWPLLRVDADLVLRYIDAREREPGALRGSHVAPLTVKKELDELRRVLVWARFRGRFPRDPATVIPPNYRGRHVPRTRWLTKEEAVKLMMELEPRRAAHVAFILATGARRGESFRAQLEDVHLDDFNPFVEIRGTKTKRAKGSVPVTGITNPFLVYALQHAPGIAPLFDPWGKMVRDLRAACKRAGIAPASANDLRRSFGKWHRLAGASAEQVSVMLRHTTDALAQTTYAQISGADIGPAMRAISPIEPVSVLYRETAETGTDCLNRTSKKPEKAASPAGFEPATPGLGNQVSTDAASTAKQGVSGPSGAPTKAHSVPVLYRTEDEAREALALAKLQWDAFDAMALAEDEDEGGDR